MSHPDGGCCLLVPPQLQPGFTQMYKYGRFILHLALICHLSAIAATVSLLWNLVWVKGVLSHEKVKYTHLPNRGTTSESMSE